MQRDSAAQLSPFIERVVRMEHQIAAVAASRGAALASGAVAARKQARGGRGHAFDPFQNPTAPDKETIRSRTGGLIKVAPRKRYSRCRPGEMDQEARGGRAASGVGRDDNP
jgi:hypothetical protein